MDNNANPRYIAALLFAVERHALARQPRKGTAFPYVVHPIRVAEILARFDFGEDVVIAGFLHDTVEDAGVGYEELEERFGERVAELVERASEPDKSLGWKERKQHTIDRVATEGDLEALGLVAADKLDNVLSLKETLRSRGADETWTIFNADRDAQRWYYRTLAQALLERAPTSFLFRTLDAEVHTIFPDERRDTRYFAGKPLGNPQDARAYLADPIKHWRPGCSAFELAAAWLGGDGVPPKIDALLQTAFGSYEIVEGFFEKQTKLDNLPRQSQTDLLLLIRTPKGLAVVGIEGKAKEPFGPLVSEGVSQARLNGLYGHLGLDPRDLPDLRYQLIHRTVAVLLEAKRYGARDALMLVQSFDPDDSSIEDYRTFAGCLGLSGAEVDTLTSSKNFGGIELRLAWAKER